MPFDLNNSRDYLGDEELAAAGGEDGGPELGPGGGLFDLNMAPAQGAADAGPALLDLNMESDLDEEDNSESGDENIKQGNEVPRRKKFASNKLRNAVYQALLASSNNGKLKLHTTRIVAATYGLHHRTVQRIWYDHKQQTAAGLQVDVAHKKTNRVGRKKKDIDFSQTPSIPLQERSTIRSLAHRLHVSLGTLHRRFKMGLIRRHSSTLKPCLKDENKKSRLRFCLSMIEPSTINTAPKLKDMKNILHIDEKWFNMTKKRKKFYLLPEEEDPHRSVQNTNCIGKVMFLAVLGLPLHDFHGNEIFSGKIDIFPFVKEEPAARSSANRPRGTLIKKSVIVNRAVMKEYMITKVLPVIKANWLEERAEETIYIQQDNARTHVTPMDPDFCAAAQETGLDIRLMQQPPNSPDMNILDLGFFSSIQSLTDKNTPRTIEQLINNVEKEYNDYDMYNVKKVFLTLQGCMIETMKLGGGNRYKIPHMNKDRLESLGILPSQLSCDLSLVQSVRGILGE